MTCWLAQFTETPCSGRLIRAHLIPRQTLRREGHPGAIEDPRSWVPACGGITGVGGCHGRLDYSRSLSVPRHALPAGLEELAEELGLTWFLEREYGPLEAAA